MSQRRPLWPTLPPRSEPGAPEPEQIQPEEYLSIAQLAERIPYRPQSIRNLMSQGVFQLDVHYVKPRGRVVFKWSAVRFWLEGARERP